MISWGIILTINILPHITCVLGTGIIIIRLMIKSTECDFNARVTTHDCKHGCVLSHLFGDASSHLKNGYGMAFFPNFTSKISRQATTTRTSTRKLRKISWAKWFTILVNFCWPLTGYVAYVTQLPKSFQAVFAMLGTQWFHEFPLGKKWWQNLKIRCIQSSIILTFVKHGQAAATSQTHSTRTEGVGVSDLSDLAVTEAWSHGEGKSSLWLALF